MSRSQDLRSAALELAEGIWEDMNDARRATRLTDAWDAVLENSADKIAVALTAERYRCARAAMEAATQTEGMSIGMTALHIFEAVLADPRCDSPMHLVNGLPR